MADYRSDSEEIGTVAFYWRIIIRPHFWAASLIAALMATAAGLETLTIGLTVPIIDAITAGDETSNNPVLKIAIGALRSLGSSRETIGYSTKFRCGELVRQ